MAEAAQIEMDKACKKATEAGIQQVRLSMVDGKLVIDGAQNCVLPLVNNEEVFPKLVILLTENQLEEHNDLYHATNKIPKYPLFPLLI